MSTDDSDQHPDDNWARLYVSLRAGMAKSGIQAAMLLNGGAAVALLSFIGNSASVSNSNIVIDLTLIKWALVDFGLGVFLAAFTFFFAYRVQALFAEDHKSMLAHRYRRVGVVMITTSQLLFLLGVVITAAALTPT